MANMASGSHPPAALPSLGILDLTNPPQFTRPAKRINEGPDVSRFLTSFAYRDIGIFVLQLNHALIPRNQPGGGSPRVFSIPSAADAAPTTPSIKALRQLLSTVESYIDEAPPDPGPRRFGNVSFRTWHELLAQRLDKLLEADELLRGVLAVGDGGAKDEVSSYFFGAFGSAQRLDYGTGHELSFLAFLGCLWKLGFFRDGTQGGDIEREIVLSVIEPYLNVVRKLILTYTLEPAGSHGVWGLDDHSFLPYIFGSAQLTRPINDADPTPLEGSVRVPGTPRTGDVAKPASVERHRETNMYFSAIGFISDVKTGPFWEHSPILFDISGVRDGWGKINKGMIKMFNAEVLSKFPVVQHFYFGSLFSWDQDPQAPKPTQSIHMVNQPMAAAAPPGPTGMGAPFAEATRMPPPSGPGMPYSRMPPPGASSGMPPPGPSSGSLASGPTGRTNDSTSAQITVTKAPWAK